jgi:hypothetical protein
MYPRACQSRMLTLEESIGFGKEITVNPTSILDNSGIRSITLMKLKGTKLPDSS